MLHHTETIYTYGSISLMTDFASVSALHYGICNSMGLVDLTEHYVISNILQVNKENSRCEAASSQRDTCARLKHKEASAKTCH